MIYCTMTQNSPTTSSFIVKENSQNFYFQAQIYWIHHCWIMTHHLADLNNRATIIQFKTNILTANYLFTYLMLKMFNFVQEQ